MRAQRFLQIFAQIKALIQACASICANKSENSVGNQARVLYDYLICRHRILKQNVEQTNTVWRGNVPWDKSVFLLPPIIHWILAYPAISGTFSFLSIPSDVGHIV